MSRNPSGSPRPEFPGHGRQRIDPHIQARLIKIDVVALFEGLFQIDNAESPFFPSVKLVVTHHQGSLIVDRRAGSDNPGLERRQSGDDLEGGAGRIHPPDRLVLKRVTGVLQQSEPFLGADPAGEVGRIEGWFADHRQNPAGMHIKSDGGSRLISEGFCGGLFQILPHRQKDLVAGDRIAGFKDPQLLAGDIHLDGPLPLLAAQIGLEVLLEAASADVIAGVVAVISGGR